MRSAEIADFHVLCLIVFICVTVVIFSGVRRIFNTGVSTFIIGERVLMRVEGQLVVAHGMSVCLCVSVCAVFVCLYASECHAL